MERSQLPPISRQLARLGHQIKFGVNNPLSRSQLLSSEKPGTTVTHRQERFAIDRPFKIKAEQISLILAEELYNPDVVVNGFADNRQAAVKGYYCIEQAIDGFTFADKINPEIAG